MNFKDKNYYISKVKEALGIITTAIAFDAILMMIIVLA